MVPCFKNPFSKDILMYLRSFLDTRTKIALSKSFKMAHQVMKEDLISFNVMKDWFVNTLKRMREKEDSHYEEMSKKENDMVWGCPLTDNFWESREFNGSRISKEHCLFKEYPSWVPLDFVMFAHYYSHTPSSIIGIATPKELTELGDKRVVPLAWVLHHHEGETTPDSPCMTTLPKLVLEWKTMLTYDRKLKHYWSRTNWGDNETEVTRAHKMALRPKVPLKTITRTLCNPKSSSKEFRIDKFMDRKFYVYKRRFIRFYRRPAVTLFFDGLMDFIGKSGYNLICNLHESLFYSSYHKCPGGYFYDGPTELIDRDAMKKSMSSHWKIYYDYHGMTHDDL